MSNAKPVPVLALAARGLTVGRLVVAPLYAATLLAVADPVGPRADSWRAGMLALLAFAALSDFFDGRWARRSGHPSAMWGWVDALADITFNALALLAAAWMGSVRWVAPVVVAVLGARYLWSAWPSHLGATRLREDRLGKAAGVVFYLLNGMVAAHLALGVPGPAGTWLVADLVVLYGLMVILRPFVVRSPDAAEAD